MGKGVDNSQPGTAYHKGSLPVCPAPCHPPGGLMKGAAAPPPSSPPSPADPPPPAERPPPRPRWRRPQCRRGDGRAAAAAPPWTTSPSPWRTPPALPAARMDPWERGEQGILLSDGEVLEGNERHGPHPRGSSRLLSRGPGSQGSPGSRGPESPGPRIQGSTGPSRIGTPTALGGGLIHAENMIGGEGAAFCGLFL